MSILISDVSVSYEGTTAVDHVTLEIAEGRLTALVGPSGCGKTSLLRAIAGLERVTTGSITIAGSVVAGPSTFIPPERRNVGMVFQQGALFPHMTVWKNVMYGITRSPAADEIVRRALDRVGMLEYRDRYPDQLSGGQQQRVALARAIAPSPAIVLLDEPFASLDASLRAVLREDVRDVLEQASMTALLVTHDQDEALSIADVVAVMQRGRILQTAAPQIVYKAPASSDVARIIGDGQLLECEVRDGRLTCPFGELSADAATGPAMMLVRPEDVRVVDCDSSSRCSGELTTRRYFGHDALDAVRLDDGRSILVRRHPASFFERGHRVALVLLTETVAVFPETGGVAAARPIVA